MTLHSEPCYSGSVFMVAKCNKKDGQHLTLMTLNQEPCKLVPIWLMTLSSQHCHTSGVNMVAYLKKEGQNITLSNLNREPCQ